MSIEAQAIVLHHSQAKGTALLTLIGIANHDGDGGSWPSIQTLAKYARCSTDQVRRNIRKLEQLGEIRVYQQQGGTATTADHQRTNLYEIMLTCPVNCDRSKNHRTRQALSGLDPLASVQPPGTHAGGSPGTHARGPLAPMQAEPSINHPSKEITNEVTTETRARRPIWIDDRCTSNIKSGKHEIGRWSKCLHCGEIPVDWLEATA